MSKKIKVCSFLPAATQMIYQLGLAENLCGVTFECDSDKPKVVRSYLEGKKYSSEEIENIVTQSKAEGRSLYYIDEELLDSISPDIIFTQEVCDVCQIDTSHVQRTLHKLKKQPRVVPLIPRNLDDVYQNIVTVATELGKEENAYKLLSAFKARTDKITDELRKNRSPLRRVMIMEWLDPIYNCGHWIPYQVALAGGVDMLSNPSGYSVITPWEKVRQYDPEALIVAPCGFNIKRAVEEIEVLMAKDGWHDLRAVKNNEVYLADANYFTQPGTTLVDGIELLAGLFHPSIFKVPQKLKNNYLKIGEFQYK